MDPQVKALEDIGKKVDEFKAAQKEAINNLAASQEKTGQEATQALEKANASAAKLEGIAAEILEIRQNAVENVMANKASPQSMGELVVASAEYEAFLSGSQQKMQFKASTTTGQEGSPLENSDTLVAPDRMAGIIPAAFRMLNVLDLIPTMQTSSNAVDYVRETAFTNAAAETNEAAAKPESDIAFELVTANVKTIAHWLKISKQVAEDAPALKGFIDTRLRHGVNQRLQKQVVTGNGTGANLSGIMTSGNHTAFTPTTGENQLDSINRGIHLVHSQDYAPNGILLNPIDWGNISRIKRGSGDAAYVFGDPAAQTANPRLWGLPVVLSNEVTAGKFAVGAFDIAYAIFTRAETVVEMFEQDDTNVQENLYTLRAENRKAFATFRPASVYVGNLVQA